MYHPAAALHQPALRKDIETDFSNLPKMIAIAQQKQAETASQAAPSSPGPLAPAQPEQLPFMDGASQQKEKPENIQKGEPRQLSLF